MCLENVLGALAVDFFVRGKDEEVVHVDDKPSFCDHVLEGVVHELLKHSWGVGESKEHDHWFKEPLMDDENRLPLMAIFDVDVVIAPSDIKLGE